MKKPVNDVVLQFSMARKMMLNALDAAKIITGQEMEKQLPKLAKQINTPIEVLSYKGSAGRGKCSRNNDRALFMWNGVRILDKNEERQYLIDFFANDCDRNTANLHSQIGHIQFASLRANAQSPHEIQAKGKAGAFIRFRDDRLEDSNQSLCDFSDNGCSLQAFEPASLVSDFFQYVMDKEKNRK